MDELRKENLWREYEMAWEAYRELVKVRKTQDPPLIPIDYMRERSREVMELKAQALGIERPNRSA
ncbi:hypothetical protein N799_08630 [Lysobacter arseniciresistens ZS79]|uniref:Uncharacterized protein n=2 Tax=Novilysobacter TaxID=3382699 RepID=A0A0A0F087_9GAMM|nr:hypothetical protein N799_08630 [Lysobacter arseniciresistens ZS79]